MNECGKFPSIPKKGLFFRNFHFEGDWKAAKLLEQIKYERNLIKISWNDLTNLAMWFPSCNRPRSLLPKICIKYSKHGPLSHENMKENSSSKAGYCSKIALIFSTPPKTDWSVQTVVNSHKYFSIFPILGTNLCLLRPWPHIWYGWFAQ